MEFLDLAAESVGISQEKRESTGTEATEVVLMSPMWKSMTRELASKSATLIQRVPSSALRAMDLARAKDSAFFCA